MSLDGGEPFFAECGVWATANITQMGDTTGNRNFVYCLGGLGVCDEDKGRSLLRQVVAGIVVASALFFVPHSAPAGAIACAADGDLNSVQDDAKVSYDKAEGSSEEITVSPGIRKTMNVKVTATQGNQRVEFLDADGDPISGSGGTIDQGNEATFEIPEGAVTIKITKTGPANGQNFKGERSFVKRCSPPGMGPMVFFGTLVLGPGIGYPCVGSTAPAVDPTKCGGFVTSNNSAVATFVGSAAGALATVDSPKCIGCVEAGTYSINASGSASGACGLSKGALTGTISPTAGLGTKSKSRNFSLRYLEVGGTVTISGTTDKGEVFYGVARAVVNPASGSSCWNKAAKEVVLAGSLAYV